MSNGKLTIEKLYDSFIDWLLEDGLVQEARMSPDGYDDNQVGIRVTSTSRDLFTIIIIDEGNEPDLSQTADHDYGEPEEN